MFGHPGALSLELTHREPPVLEDLSIRVERLDCCTLFLKGDEGVVAVLGVLYAGDCAVVGEEGLDVLGSGLGPHSVHKQPPELKLVVRARGHGRSNGSMRGGWRRNKAKQKVAAVLNSATDKENWGRKYLIFSKKRTSLSLNLRYY